MCVLFQVAALGCRASRPVSGIYSDPSIGTKQTQVIGDVYTSYSSKCQTHIATNQRLTEASPVPDYTAYQQVLSAFKRLIPIPTILEQEDSYRFDIQQMKKDIHRQGISVILASNPRNPTGQVIEGDDLKDLVQLSREHTTVILDEFYSWYMYPEREEDLGRTVSSAEYIEGQELSLPAECQLLIPARRRERGFGHHR